MAKHLSFPVLLCLVFSCSPVAPASQCDDDVDCGESLVCSQGICVAQLDSACRSDQTRPCGPQANGVCRPGVQRCIDGAFEVTCFGAVTGSAEVCNGVDDDCDGVIDDGLLTTFSVDGDGDGFGSSATNAQTVMACEKPAGFSATADDCNDAAAAINPSATETCDAFSIDENCDGVANESCACTNPGMAQACCAGRGSQSCDLRDGGAMLSACTVIASRELCNGVDDDCDGQTDESFAITSADGGLLSADAGTLLADGGCVTGVGACERTAGVSCFGGSLTCLAIAGTPNNEICNTLDDDCDGQTDEASATLCPTTGQSCTAGTCACPPSQTVCGTSCESIGGSCSAGTGACLRSGTNLCTSGAAACSAVAGAPGAEICNSIDDNCDGQTDEASATLCSVTGQSCNAGTCACPASQTVCGTSCQTLGGTCSVGVGACNRSGAIACISGGASCNATAGAPATEVCDGVDNNCDGSTDEGVTVTCLVDADNDRYAAGSAQSQRCPDSARASFGTCPLGFVAPANSMGVDCNDANDTLFRPAATYADADNDARCAGSEATVCIGQNPPAGRRLTASCLTVTDCDDSNPTFYARSLSRADADRDFYCTGVASNTCNGVDPPTGRRFPSFCNPTDDCNDSSASQFVSWQVRADSDNDSYCVGGAVTQCGGNAPNTGTRVATRCQASDDCNDSSSTFSVLGPTRVDADNDGFCVGVAATTCNGTNAPAGRRFPATCDGFGDDDCNDSNANQYFSRQVRTDEDNDGYCVGSTVTQCGGASPNPGTREATSCLGNDCRDVNAQATTSCFLAGGYQAPATKRCSLSSAPGPEDRPAVGSCPPGFSRILLPYLGSRSGVAGTCTVVNDTTMTMTCGFAVLGDFTCNVAGDCAAN